MAAPANKGTARKWIAHAAIPVTALVCVFGFWRLAPGLTFAIALVAALWVAGKD